MSRKGKSMEINMDTREVDRKRLLRTSKILAVPVILQILPIQGVQTPILTRDLGADNVQQVDVRETGIPPRNDLKVTH